jgi:protein-arginine kinase activator protein McsA
MSEVQFKEALACDVCGRFGAFEFEGTKLCAECYETRSSCCPEFGADDQSRVREDTLPKKPDKV